jgi:UDP-N-acetylglucosamine 1-carboxyvinyltransferase
VTHTVVPDRIEAATFAIAAAATRGNISIPDVRPEHMTSVIDALRVIGATVHVAADRLDISTRGPMRGVELAALPFPGIPTDTQAQFMALLATASGISVVTDRVFPDRFMHASELVRMGALIRREGASVVIDGGGQLTGTSVMASDLRASAALVIAALAADEVEEDGGVQQAEGGADGALDERDGVVPPLDAGHELGSVRHGS